MISLPRQSHIGAPGETNLPPGGTPTAHGANAQKAMPHSSSPAVLSIIRSDIVVTTMIERPGGTTSRVDTIIPSGVGS